MVERVIPIPITENLAMLVKFLKTLFNDEEVSENTASY